MPNDGAVLMLLYSIEEYQALVTSEPVPDGHVQATYASTIVDKFLSGSMQSLPRALVPAATIDELRQTIEQVRASSVTTSLPKNLFQDVYQATYAELGAAFDKFKQTREYALLQTRRQQERTVLSVDELLDDAWNCTVFWMFLYRTAHHHRLSFLMDKTFKLDVLHKDFVDNETPAAYSALVAALKLMARKFLAKSAPVSLSMTAASSIRLREEIAVEISYLSSQRTDHQTIERIMDKLNELYTDARTEFKSTCLERLTSFAASSLYRDFIDLVPATKQQATSPRSAPHDIVQLLRASRLPFHQAPVLPPCVDDLGALLRSCTTSATPDTANKSEVIQNVFMFIKTDLVTAQARVHPFEFVTLYEAPDVDPSRWSELHQTVEHFLVPEAAPRTFQITDSEAQQELCFNFVAGNGDNALYGAVWRTPLLRENLPPTVQGICVVSRHPVIDSLRSFLQVFARKRRLAVDVAATNTGGNTQFPAVIGDDVASTLDEAKAHLHVRLLDKHTTTTQEPSSSPESSDAISRSVSPPVSPVDFELDDLFDCLSMANILRLFAMVLLEKKILLVSSSYSVLLSVGEALKALMHPLAWSHVYVPVLPMALKGYLHCPTPFIFGVHTAYVRNSDVPRPSDDLVLVNLDRDCLTGGGDVVLPPARANVLRDKLAQLCKPRLLLRDHVDYLQEAQALRTGKTKIFPSDAIRAVFQAEVTDILTGLEAYAFRFEFHGKSVSIVDTSNKSRQWASDSARFSSALLQTQAFSAHISGLSS
ncbi:TPA: hypothetical protein N0F65_007459 [Lagenidium giganteum]|uniref:UDENN domain-containing protein n=1 Tax=Lagenidium giganteum TaxID=4803 RepID=A0AAV2ZL09_9STRA|nr:TPA: hypothetical protein N0F65_007459 [Lagenidium giganteum]